MDAPYRIPSARRAGITSIVREQDGVPMSADWHTCQERKLNEPAARGVA